MRFMITVSASKAIIASLIERRRGLNGDTARRLAPVLSQGCEFALGLLASDAIERVIGEPMANLLTLAVTLSLAEFESVAMTLTGTHRAIEVVPLWRRRALEGELP
jgi:hypothetical protein